ncbi:putative nucleotide-binding alpha-beta plait domain superfamily, RNA-binding domain superfamily [Helianthus annuus]|nr:putative nucleotide-binding alpha-beta plait domain superfamily, RNA-binding domain superfamily [Helianthus annuus]KAJ0607608.1 putative nucleotide-binding alpha-beta plait domain superfamily, RNA-binding domain superfamily [Helianthus annuus]KAJ0767671.1 putative nucleotide-binding alpha-beta plait domain superfamily, RNA-binding domain superfamily [Helianthus annuus]
MFFILNFRIQFLTCMMLMWRWLVPHQQRKRNDQFAGYGHVEIATLEAAQKTLQVNGEPLLDHLVKLDLAKEKHTLLVPEMRGLSKRVRRSSTNCVCKGIWL